MTRTKRRLDYTEAVLDALITVLIQNGFMNKHQIQKQIDMDRNPATIKDKQAK